MKHIAKLMIVAALGAGMAAAAQAAAPVPYLDPVNHTTNLCDTYTPYTGQTTLDTGWYVVSGDITNDTRIAVSGDVNLILCDGCTLSTGGVKAAPGGSLTIWGQTEGTGTLIADGRATYNPGIECTDASVTINGGTVNATGNQWTAGIGGYFEEFGGSGHWSIGDPTPYPGGTVTVNGGTVNATGGEGAAGIGGSMLAAGGPVTITGGTVVAKAGAFADSYGGDPAQAIGRGQGSADSGDLIIPGMKVYASEDATEPVAAGDRMAACRGGWAKLAPCAPHAVASCRWCGMESFLVRKLFDGEHHGTNTFATVELTVYSEAAKSPDARGSCLTYVIEGGGIDCTDNVDENGQHAKLNGVYGIEQANHSMAVFNDAGWAYIKADLKENSTIRVTGEFGPYQPEYAAEAPNGMDKRKTLSTTGLLQGQTFYVIERDPGYFYAGPTGYVYTGDDEAADPRVDAGGMAATQALTMEITDETDYLPPEYSNNPEGYTPATIPEGALFLKGEATGAPTTVFVVNETDETKFTDMAARVKEYDEPYDGQGHGLGVTMSGSEVDDYDWTGRYALGDSTGPTNAWSGVKPVFTNVCDETVWVEAVLEGWSGTTSGVVRIRPAALAITAKNQTCDFDDRPHGEDRATYTDPAEIAAKVEVSGLVPGDGLASVTLDGTRTAPGTEPIIPSGATVTNATGDVTFNYAVNYTNGTLTILGPPPEVMDVTAAPTGGSWQGQVDIFFNVTNDVARGLPDWNAPFLSIVATDHLTGSNYVADASALTGDTDAADGPHSVTWDMDAQGINLASSNVTFTVAYLRMPDYCVIDLSGGSNAAHYAVSYLDAEPEGGFNTGEYKTTKLAMRLLAPGTFTMGDDQESNNKPHEVTLTQPFYCAVFETTQKQWELVMRDNPSRFKDYADSPMRPVECVSLDSIRYYAVRIQHLTGLSTLDIPTEEQWEYACRAGTTTAYGYGDAVDVNYMWFGGIGGSMTHEVGTKLPNAWGLYDMHGNVWEWVLKSTESPWLIGRGGSWLSGDNGCTSAYQVNINSSSYSDYTSGFRLVRTLSGNLEGEPGTREVCAGASAPVALVKDASVAFCGTFTLTGREMAAGEFAAGLYDAAGNSLQTVTNAADGSFAFEAIEYGLADAGKTFSYVVKQVAGTAGGVQYDTTEHTVEVVVFVGADRLVANVTDNFTNLDFANCVIGDLRVSNSVTSSAAADKNRDFSFTVTLEDLAMNGTYGDMTFMDGVAEFTLKDGETATASGLPKGIGYTVVQDAAGGFTTSAENATGAVATTGAMAAFTNVRNNLALAVTAGKWGAVAVKTNGVECATVGPDATTNLVIVYSAEVTAAAVPDAGFAVTGDTNAISFASYTENTNLVFSFVPNPAAELRWKFSATVGRHFAQVAIPAHAGYAEALEDLAYVFADRTNAAGMVYAQLWDATAKAPQGVLLASGSVDYRGVALDAAAFGGTADGESVSWGVSDATLAGAAGAVPAGERGIGMFVRNRVNPASGNETAGEVESFVGYLTWTTDGTRYFQALVEGSAPGAAGTEAAASASATGAAAPPTTYAVVFKANGGTGSMAAQTMSRGKKANLSANVFQRKGYVFLGWAKTAKGAVAYKNKAVVRDLAPAGSRATLHAKWAKKTYKVKFCKNGGTGTMPLQKMTYGKAKRLAANKFTREGYVFRGWATSAAKAGKGVVAYSNRKRVKNLTKTGKTVKLYAVWRKK